MAFGFDLVEGFCSCFGVCAGLLFLQDSGLLFVAACVSVWFRLKHFSEFVFGVGQVFMVLVLVPWFSGLHWVWFLALVCSLCGFFLGRVFLRLDWLMLHPRLDLVF